MLISDEDDCKNPEFIVLSGSWTVRLLIVSTELVSMRKRVCELRLLVLKIIHEFTEIGMEEDPYKKQYWSILLQ